MKSVGIFILGSILSCTVNAAQSFYCPQKHAYINVGMTMGEVTSACGDPAYKRRTNNPVVQKIPVTQLMYTTLNPGSVYPGWTTVYNQWSLPSGSTGTSVQVDIINNKITGIKINGSNTNAMTICSGVPVQIGDDSNSVYSACGTPSMVNQSYINKSVPESSQPEVWVYQLDQYQAPISLTFVNGALQSIDQTLSTP